MPHDIMGDMPEDPKPQKPSPREGERKRLEESERLGSLRERLYARGNESDVNLVRHELNTSSVIPEMKVSERADTMPTALPPEPAPLVATYTNLPMPHAEKGTSFRTKFVILGIIFFVITLAVAGVFLFMGNNTISGNNITIDVKGPLSVGGGDVMDLQVAVANQNTLPIESATLIVTYPNGTQSIAESGKELFNDRIQLNSIDPNEVVNVPIRVLMFGEENDVKEVKVSVEYRVEGSNATFYKEALPYEFKISTSPVVININAVKSIPTGQETEIEVVIQSNSKESLTDLVLKASYPQGFSFTSSVPDTASGQDTWKLKTLKSGDQLKVLIKGKMSGVVGDENQFDFAVGVTNERDSLSIVSPLAKREIEINIERPFLDVKVSINGESGDTVVVDPKESASVVIEFINALETPVYDGVISAQLTGNAIDEVLRELTPGKTNKVSFVVKPKSDTKSTPEMKVLVTIQGNRVGQDRVPERVVGTIERTIRVASVAKLTTSVIYSEGPFVNSGPVPPIAEKITQYTFLLTMRNGTNPVTGAEVTAIMPPYVTWLDMTSDNDSVSYSRTNRTLKWSLGDLKINEYREVWVQVAYKPSLSQVGSMPVLLEAQRYRATDRFTDAIVRTEAEPLTTSLTKDPNPAFRDGRVREK
jgi:hypothetical protein